MKRFSKKLSIIAKDTNNYLKKILSKKNNSYLVRPMKYGIFSGGKRFRSAIIVNTGKIFGINYKKLIAVGYQMDCRCSQLISLILHFSKNINLLDYQHWKYQL